MAPGFADNPPLSHTSQGEKLKWYQRGTVGSSSIEDRSISYNESHVPRSRLAVQHAKVSEDSVLTSVLGGYVTTLGRRVKCDERKPVCSRCEKGGFRCEGYKDPVDRPRPRPADGTDRQFVEPADLRPKPLQRRIIPVNGICPAHMSLNISLPPVLLNSQDASYFDAFRYHVVEDFNGWTGPGFWDSLVMRESLEDECIRHSILGLSALTRASWVPKAQSDEALKDLNSSLEHPKLPRLESNDHRAALSHYLNAISMCRENSEKNKDSIAKSYVSRRLLICTIVFIVMEMMQGNVGAAVKLVDSGLSLIENASRGGDFDPDSEWTMTETIFKRFSMITGLIRCFSGVPEQIKTHAGIPTWDHARPPQESVPTTSVLHQWSHAFGSVRPFIVKIACGHRVQQSNLWELNENLHSRASEMDEWQEVVDKHAKKNRDAKVQRELLFTKLQILVTRIYMSCCLDMTEMAYDTHTKDFQQIVDIAEIFSHSENSGRMRLTVGFNLFPWLGFTIAKCRDLHVRQYALDTSIRLIFRQGGWGNLGFIKALRALVVMEEDGRNENGIIPSERRYLWSLRGWDLEQHQIWMHCDPVIKSSDDDTRSVVQEVAIDY
ncbi:uncharacterized protein JN550_012187 [Neoarthrinium moseri]|uniref:uncharacterized protein n=1 Tax=Neoarthrinium moseri TaxID=1658444 RepID=UPI001FDB96AD|nr:uncharacterized protein JN550_012187 [Neoarthrinium moseri]KAI1859174.1 hypothetical protein JN550_012187 [Neoarthrinium moseri]